MIVEASGPSLAAQITAQFDSHRQRIRQTGKLPEAGPYSQPEYHTQTNTSYDRVAAAFDPAQLQELIPKGNILEIGCSFGLTTVELLYLLGGDVRITGIDINAQAVGVKKDEALARYNALLPEGSLQMDPSYLDFQVGDGYKPDFPDHSFMGVFAMHNFWYAFESNPTYGLPVESRPLIMAQIRRILRPDGHFFLSREGEEHSSALIFHKPSSGEDALILFHSSFDSLSPESQTDMCRANFDKIISIVCAA